MSEQTINPDESSTYRVLYDDGCIVVLSGIKPDAPKVWLSAAMIRWLVTAGLRMLGEAEMQPYGTINSFKDDWNAPGMDAYDKEAGGECC